LQRLRGFDILRKCIHREAVAAVRVYVDKT